jgi:hypothetical protein
LKLNRYNGNFLGFNLNDLNANEMNFLSAVQKHPIDEAKTPYFGAIKTPPPPSKSHLKQRNSSFLTLFKKLLKLYKNLYFQAIRGEALRAFFIYSHALHGKESVFKEIQAIFYFYKIL